MKRIDCRQAAIEGCSTRAGTVVGPLMTELVGFPDLTHSSAAARHDKRSWAAGVGS
jgi:hypothetical protein